MTENKWTWNIRYNAQFTDEVDSEEYAWQCHKVIKEREMIYPFIGDSRDYFVLGEAADLVAKTPGLFCEIGLRQGGGAKILMNSIIGSDVERTLVSVDPFGAIPFVGMENELLPATEYTNFMQKETLEKVYRFLQMFPKIYFIYYPLEDTEFFERFKTGVPVYANSKKEIVNQYALVHFDGPHDLKITMDETKFFIDKVPVGGVFVYDDVLHFYDHNAIKKFLLKKGWEQIQETKVKASYIKVGE